MYISSLKNLFYACFLADSVSLCSSKRIMSSYRNAYTVFVFVYSVIIAFPLKKTIVPFQVSDDVPTLN